jgi:tetrahydromethanopterin S-methyltransferase subunit C
LCQRLAYAAQFVAAGAGPAVVLGVEQVKAVAAGLLGGVHRLIGMAKQGFGIGAVLSGRA